MLTFLRNFTHTRSLTHTHTHTLSLSLSLSHTHTHSLSLTLSLTHSHTHSLSLSLTHTLLCSVNVVLYVYNTLLVIFLHTLIHSFKKDTFPLFESCSRSCRDLLHIVNMIYYNRPILHELNSVVCVCPL